MDGTLFVGLTTALTTQFKDDGGINWDAMATLIETQIASGVHVLCPCGTTGESPTLSHEEHIQMIKFVVERARGQVPVLAGVGSNSTREAVQLALAAKQAGANGGLAVSPYYNKPTSAGLIDYYRQLAEVGLPIILYDIPGRVGGGGVPVNIALKLAKEGTICGVKWANGNFGWLMEFIKAKPKSTVVLSGDDNFTFPLMALGGNGAISVLSNLTPKAMTSFMYRCLKSDWDEAREEHYQLLPLMQAMFLETNPIPVKAAMALVYPEIYKATYRSPIMPMSEANLKTLSEVLRNYDFIK